MPEKTMTGPHIDMLDVSLRRDGRIILDSLTWRMNAGEHWAIIGANGSGKTTLLKIAGGLLYPTAGEVTVLGGRFGRCDLARLRRKVGWVGSALVERIPPGETVRDVVASGPGATFGLMQALSPADWGRVDDSLRRVGLEGLEESRFGVLSQGERQRALFARAMAACPGLYILDEACAGLDLPAREMFLAVADRVMAAGDAGVIMVTHHIEELPAGITHALLLKKGRALASGPAAEVVTGEGLSEAFGIDVAVERKDGRFRATVKQGGVSSNSCFPAVPPSI